MRPCRGDGCVLLLSPAASSLAAALCGLPSALSLGWKCWALCIPPQCIFLGKGKFLGIQNLLVSLHS